MKTLKLVMIATFVSVAMVSFSNSVESENPKSKTGVPEIGKTNDLKQIVHIYLSLNQATQIPQFVYEMNRQLDPSMLKHEKRSYTATITYLNYIIHVTGSYNDWARFFNPKIVVVGYGGFGGPSETGDL